LAEISKNFISGQVYRVKIETTIFDPSYGSGKICNDLKTNILFDSF